MKANELRIGNKLLFEGLICEVYSLSKTGAKIGSGNEMEYKYINPLPLTPELLDKCGAEKIINSYNKNPTQLKLDVSPAGYVRYYFDEQKFSFFVYLDFHVEEMEINELKYLHQLQNLYFALTGEELQIEL